MALPYGINITAGDMKELERRDVQQKSGVRTWRQLLGGASLGYESQADTMKSYYSDAMAEAYKSNFAQQDVITGAGLNLGASQDFLSANRQELQATYETYLKNYAANLQTAGEGYGEEVGAITQGLAERSEKFSALYDSAYKYFAEELFSATKGENEDMVQYLNERGLNWLQTADEPMSWQDIMYQLMSEDGKSLNERGTQFFDAMFNARPEGFTTEGEKTRSFGEWLSSQDVLSEDSKLTGKELYEWAASIDAFNPTYAGTNLGTIKARVGLESLDDSYSKAEYSKGVNLKTLEKDNILKYTQAVAKARTSFNESAKAASEAYSTSWKPGIYSKMAKSHAARERAAKSLADYKEQANKLMNTLNINFKDLVGTERYETFRKENNDLFVEYEELMKTIQKLNRFDSSQVDKLKKVHSELSNKMIKFIDAKKKISGY